MDMLRKLIVGILCASVMATGIQMPVFAGEAPENSGIVSDNEAVVSDNDVTESEKGENEGADDKEKAVSENTSVSEDEPDIEEDPSDAVSDDTAIENGKDEALSEEYEEDAANAGNEADEASVFATPESDFDWSGNTITKYNGAGGDIIIPKRADQIGAEAFKGKSISSVRFEQGSTCSVIGAQAFNGCGITSLELPDSITEIGYAGFANNRLVSVTLPRMLQTLGDGAFDEYNQKNYTITSVTVKSVALTTVGRLSNNESFCYDGIFKNMPITSITFADDVKAVPQCLFKYADLSNADIVLPKSVTKIGKEAFFDSKLKSVAFKGSVVEIGKNAFQGTNLVTINLGSSMIKLGESAFFGTPLTKIDLPAQLKEVGQSCFQECKSLKEIKYNSIRMVNWMDMIFRDCSSIEKITIGRNVKYIPEGFVYGMDLENVSIKIPSGVEEIGAYAFWNTKLGNVEFEGNNLKKIGRQAFYGCPLKELNLPASVELIEGGRHSGETGAFAENNSLTKVVLPRRLKSADNYSFANNKSLQRVAIFKDTRMIWDGGEPSKCFEGCSTEILTIYGYAGSDAEKFAKLKGYAFKPISEWEDENPYGKKPAPSGTDPETGSATINGEPVTSLKAAFKKMKDEKEYEIVLLSDMDGEKNLTIPKNATKVTIKGNGNTVKIIGTKLISNTDLVLENVMFSASNAKGMPVNFTVNAKKRLAVMNNVAFDSRATIIRTGGELELSGDLGAEQVNAGSLKLARTGSLTVDKDCKATVRGNIASDGGSIILGDGFNKPITINGEAAGTVKITGSSLADGTQVFSARKRMIGDDTLRTVFDVSGITKNTTATYLRYYSNGKAGIFGDNIRYNGKDYGLWTDAVTQMNLDKESGTDSFAVSLIGDVNAAGALRMPKKGYSSLSLSGNGHVITFIGNITLTGDTTVTDLTFRKVNRKGQQVNGKVIKKRYSYTGPETF